MNALWDERAASPPQPLHRAMRVQDLDAVLAIEQRAYGFPWTRGNFIDSIAAGYLAEVLVAADRQLLGYFIVMAGFDELHLLNITVAPEHQSKGHGRCLLAAVQAHGHERGLAALWLEVREGNHRARALYRSIGFVERGLRRAYYPAAGQREDAVVMRLLLRAEPESGAGDVV